MELSLVDATLGQTSIIPVATRLWSGPARPGIDEMKQGPFGGFLLRFARRVRLMRILVLHTGGTIGMASSAEGLVPRDGVVEAAVAEIEARQDPGTRIEIHRLRPLIDSAQTNQRDWLRMAEVIARNHDDHDGFVVIHGTDTLAYSAAALCFTLRGLAKPVIVTGAMLPLTVEGSDGWRNLADALNAARTAPTGVWVQFAGRLLHGARVFKAHATALDAFDATEAAALPRLEQTDFGVAPLTPHRVAVLSLTPDVDTGLIAHAAETCDGLVLRCFGAGTAPDSPALRAALSRAQAREIPVVAVSQCARGGVRIGTYAAGGYLRDLGVIDGADITTEAAFVKLQAALSQHTDFEQRREFLKKSQCGEIGRTA